MALVKKDKEDVASKTEVKKAVADQQQKIADAQAKIEAARDAGATAGEGAKPEVLEPEVMKEEEKIPEDTAKAADTKEVTPKVEAGAVTKPMGRISKIFEDRKDIMLAPYGTFPRIKTGSGDFTDGDIKYGTWLKFEMLSYNELFVITPNDDSKDKAVQEEVKAAIKYSYDGINLDDGTGLVADYMEKLKKDWDNPCIKNYRECVGILHDCDNKAQAEDNIGGMVQLQLAPTSRAKLEGHVMAASFQVQRGVYTEDEAAIMMIKAKSASGGGYNWTNFIFSKA